MEDEFEAINAKIELAKLADYQPGGKNFRKSGLAAESTATILTNVCGIYKIVRPILKGIVLIPIIPRKWRDAISTFIGVLDTICP